MSDIVLTDKTNGSGATPLAPEVADALKELRALESSILLARFEFARQHGITFDGERDEYRILGYDRTITNKQYRDEYARGGIAGRIVDTPPNATWRGKVEIIEDEDPKVKTAFEQAWIDLDARLNLQAKFLRVDKLSTLSTYAVLLIGAPGDLNAPLPKGKGKADDILYVSPFGGGGGPGGSATDRTAAFDADATIHKFDVDPKSPRFGLPQSYMLKRVDVASPLLGVPVHWSRFIHVAENLLEDEVYGQPALERVWNDLINLRKVVGGGAEAFWLRANQGFHIDIDKDMGSTDPSLGLDKLKEQIEKYKHGLDRWLRTKGTNVEVLGSDVANFANPADSILTLIAGSKAIPKRILTGSEMGELASSQDRDNWQDQVNGRQTGHAEPNILRPFIDRLVEYGYLPAPKKGPRQYQIRWSPISKLSAAEKNAIGSSWAGINAQMGDTVFTRDEIREAAADKGPLSEEQLAQIEAEKAEKLKQQQEMMKAQGQDEESEEPFAEERAAEGYRMSSTQVQLPGRLAERLLMFGASIPDDYLATDGREYDPHITVKYGFKTDDPAWATKTVNDFQGPIRFTLGPLAVFANGEHDVLYATVDSPDLVKLNLGLCSFFDQESTYKKYTPHATIAYLKPGLGEGYVGDLTLDGFSGEVTEVIFIDRNKIRTSMTVGLRAAEDSKLTRRFSFPDLRQSASFLIALLRDANESNHHPDVVVEGSDVTVSYCTHAAGDVVTELDRQAMARAEQMANSPRSLEAEESEDIELIRVLQAAIEAGNAEVIARIVGLPMPEPLTDDFHAFARIARRRREPRTAGGTGSGNFGHGGGEGGPGNPGGSSKTGGGGGYARDAARFQQLQVDYARVNGELEGLMSYPQSQEAQKKSNELRAIVKEISTLNADPGGIEGVGLPGPPRDVVIIGGGPAGMAASVMAGYGGLDTLLVEANEKLGGQAQQTTRVENYLGFPIGARGEHMLSEMDEQVNRLGADRLFGTRATNIEHDESTGIKTVTLSNGDKVQARTVIIAGGVGIRQHTIPGGKENINQFYSDNVNGLVNIAKTGQPVVIAGGGNGAAQAALGAARHADVTLVSRSPLSKEMDTKPRIAVENHPRIKVVHSEISSIGGDTVKLANGNEVDGKAVGIFFGGPPNTEWLTKKVNRDAKGFVVTDDELKTNIPGVFAAGDVRHRGGRRIGRAVGDGQQAIQTVWAYIKDLQKKGKGN